MTRATRRTSTATVVTKGQTRTCRMVAEWGKWFWVQLGCIQVCWELAEVRARLSALRGNWGRVPMTGEKQMFPHLQKTPRRESGSHRPVMLTWLLGKSWNKSSWNTLTQEGGAWEQSAWIDQPQIILTNPITFHDKLTRFADEGKEWMAFTPTLAQLSTASHNLLVS